VIATLGTATGLAMGVFMGAALVHAIDRLSDANISVDWSATQLLVVLAAGIVLGYLAALIPAHRSTRPPVLEAIQES
jgi:putative ABC transport system permease protein